MKLKRLIPRSVYRRFLNERAHRQRLQRLAANRLCHSNRQERLSVVLLSYKRPKNIDKLLSSLLLCPFVDEIVVSNNNPHIRMETHLHLADPRVAVINQAQRCYASIRFDISLHLKSEFILAIDDDIFLEPEQIQLLFHRLLETPEVPHGVGGEIFSEDLSEYRRVARSDEPVEALSWLFAYTREHVLKYFELLDRLGIDNHTFDSSEDVPLSFSGKSHARVHDIGKLAHCPTNTREGIATCMNHGFFDQRKDLVRKMRGLCRFDPALLQR